MSFVSVDGLAVEYRSGAGRVRPVEDLSFSIEQGQLALMLGPSGCGKTSTLSCLAGILSPAAGRIEVDGAVVTELGAADLVGYRRSGVGMVFQAFNLVASLTALENVAVPLWAAGMKHKPALQRAEAALGTVNLLERRHHRPGQLSGGQQQRVAVARALVNDAPFLLADEPTAHLDYVQAEVVLRLLRQLADAGRCVVISTHDSRLLPLSDQVIRMVADREEAPVIEEPLLSLTAGELLFAQGDPADFVYEVVSGEIDLQRGADLLRTCAPGGYFGELGPLLGFPRTATAVARTDAILRRIGVVEFRQRMDSHGSALGQEAHA